MKRTQNEKILQIQNETVVVGIDIGKETHYARALDHRGIDLAKMLRFTNTALEYYALETWLQTIQEENAKTDAIVGFEPTGTTGLPLAIICKDRTPANIRLFVSGQTMQDFDYLSASLACKKKLKHASTILSSILTMSDYRTIFMTISPVSCCTSSLS